MTRREKKTNLPDTGRGIRLGIVIGTRNRLPMLRACLDSLRDRVSTPHCIVVVDAGSQDGTLAYLESLPQVILVRDRQPLGQARSLNRVFARLNCDYLCWLSDDNLVRPGALDLAVDILDRHPRVGMVALKVRDIQGPHRNAPYIGGVWPSGILTANQGVFRREPAAAWGFFDERYHNYGIDPDLTARFLLAGYRVVLTRSVALWHDRRHHQAPGAIPNPERARRLEAARRIYRRKYPCLFQETGPARLGWRMRQWLWRRVVAPSWSRLRLLGLVRERLWGLHQRDWFNLLNCRFVSPADFWVNRDRPFYLVQEIPPRALASWGPSPPRRG